MNTLGWIVLVAGLVLGLIIKTPGLDGFDVPTSAMLVLFASGAGILLFNKIRKRKS